MAERGPTFRAYQHPLVRLYNRLEPGRGLLERFTELTEESVLAGARGRSDLSEFGDEWFREPLRALLASFRNEAGLTGFGRFATRERIVHGLRQRLEVVRLLAEQPEIAHQPVERPIFITGLPRTGTSLLYRLLACDCRRRPLLLEEALSAVPMRWRGRGRDLRQLEARLLVRVLSSVAPELEVVHPLRQGQPEEDLWLLLWSFATTGYVVDATLPSYLGWLESKGTEPTVCAYQDHRRWLQVLQWQTEPRPWLLKSPIHLGELDALLEVYPDARLIVTHRDPAEVAASACSLVGVTRSLLCSEVDPYRLGAEVVALLERGLRRSTSVRRGLPPGRIVDVPYHELVRSPLDAVRAIYDRLGETLEPETEQAMTGWLTADRRRRRPSHRYTLDQFGLDESSVRARLAAA